MVEDVLELVFARSGGNPLYAIEIAMRLVEEEIIKIENKECVVTWIMVAANHIYKRTFTQSRAHSGG